MSRIRPVYGQEPLRPQEAAGPKPPPAPAGAREPAPAEDWQPDDQTGLLWGTGADDGTTALEAYAVAMTGTRRHPRPLDAAPGPRNNPALRHAMLLAASLLAFKGVRRRRRAAEEAGPES